MRSLKYSIGNLQSSILSLLAAGMMAGTAWAGTAITSTGTGNWEADGTWNLNRQPTTGDDVTIATAHTVTVTTATQKTIESLTVNGMLTHSPGSTYKIDLNIAAAAGLTISGTGAINVNGCGYARNTGTILHGGVHGGEGGNGAAATGVPTSPTYGSVTNPVTAGGASPNNAGGGVVIISCGGNVTITSPGKITAEGSPHSGVCNMAGGAYAGAGGSVNISAVQLLGNGSISANGGDDLFSTCGSAGGGGGRIAVVLSGAAAPVGYTLSARGGNGYDTGNGYGAAGTIYLKGTGDTLGRLKIANPVTSGGAGAKTLLPAGTWQFDSIDIVGGYSILAVGSGVTLNLDGCTVSTTGGGKVVQKGTGVLNWTSTYTLTYTLSQQGNGTWTLPGDLVVGTGGYLTHETRYARTEDASTWLKIDIGSHNLTVGPGTINVVRCGEGNSYGIHGGEGGKGSSGNVRTPTYGSITNPVTAGGGSYNRNPGGGIVVIQGTGNVTVDSGKEINASGSMSHGCNDGSAGGSVNLRVGQLLGAGSIKADGADGSECEGGGGGGGGRIAVVLSGAVAPVGFTMTANGGAAPSSDYGYGGAGTIYLQGTDSPDGRGLLRISNPTLTGAAGATTLIWEDTSVGSVELLNQAKLKIDSNRTMTVYGSWSNAAGATAISGGTVVFAGTSPNPVYVWGGNTWSNLTIATAGKIVCFEQSKTQTVYGLPTFANGVTLQSTLSPSWWYLYKPGSGTQDVGQVSAQDSNATNGWAFRPSGGANLGHNVNWLFPPKGTVFLLR